MLEKLHAMWRRRKSGASRGGKPGWPRAARKAAAGLVTLAALAGSPDICPPAAAQEFTECDGLLAAECGRRGMKRVFHLMSPWRPPAAA